MGGMELANSNSPSGAVYTAVSNSGLLGGGCCRYQILSLESQISADGILESAGKTTTIYGCCLGLWTQMPLNDTNRLKGNFCG